MKALILILIVLSCLGCASSKANLVFVAETMEPQADLPEVIRALTQRFEALGGRVETATVKGRQIEMRVFLENPDLLSRLLERHEIEFAIADDEGLHALSDALATAVPNAQWRTTHLGPDNVTRPCLDSVEALRGACAEVAVEGRRWAVETLSYGERELYCALLLFPAALTGSDIRSAQCVEDEFGHHVRAHFSLDGGQRFAALTAANVRARLGVVADGELLMLPVIMEEISGGTVHLSMGNATDAKQDCEALAGALNAAELGTGLELISVDVIPADP